MQSFYVTFSASQKEMVVNGVGIDSGCIVEVKASHYSVAKKLVEEVFGNSYAMIWLEEDKPTAVKYYPRGVVLTLETKPLAGSN